MTESVLLTAGAGLLGMVFAAWGVDLIHSAMRTTAPVLKASTRPSMPT